MAALGSYVRFEAPLPPRVKALAVLATARENEGDYVWTANLPQARSAGIDEATISAIRERRAPQGLAPEDALIVQFTLELADNLLKAEHQRGGAWRDGLDITG